MSKIDEYIAKRSKQSADFARKYKEESQKLQVAVEVRNLREELGMSQRKFAELVGKTHLNQLSLRLFHFFTNKNKKY
ncbi:hypothetical protein ODV15_10575 [Lactobacillus amylovorus]|uniref:HTH cro/C1-type domain-containing protein n=1 Tax=Lactobacillus amylovorus TaxID=1604 RepID=A0A9X4ADG2_LACAM|nr:hypothetical protein [Lactobacillus amylovorus]MDB6262982.1 hypothetical protein [Lactobacillus amylovorus]